MERLEGRAPSSLPTVEDPAIEPYQLMGTEFANNFFHDLANWYIKLSELKFAAIGMIQPLTIGMATSIGPLFSAVYTPVLQQWFGPFLTNRDRYCTQIDHVLRQISEGVAFKEHPVTCYLFHLTIKDMVMNDQELAKVDNEFYIAHQDAKGDHVLLREDGHIAGMIDWEW